VSTARQVGKDQTKKQNPKNPTNNQKQKKTTKHTKNNKKHQKKTKTQQPTIQPTTNTTNPPGYTKQKNTNTRKKSFDILFNYLSHKRMGTEDKSDDPLPEKVQFTLFTTNHSLSNVPVLYEVGLGRSRSQ